MRRVIRFERLILFPLDLAFIFFALMAFIRGDWFGGIFAIVVSLLIGIIGQSLHKNKTAAELAKGEHLIPNDSEDTVTISPIESQILAKGLVYSSVVLAVATIVLTIHSTSDDWWFVALKGIGAAVLFPIVSLFFILMVPKIIEGMRGRK
jgi:hypothetical protein